MDMHHSARATHLVLVLQTAITCLKLSSSPPTLEFQTPVISSKGERERERLIQFCIGVVGVMIIIRDGSCKNTVWMV